MRLDFFGLGFEVAGASFSLLSPWRAPVLANRCFKAVQEVPGLETTEGSDELQVKVTNPRTWQAALDAVTRVLKAWQEDAELGDERRSWRWVLRGDGPTHSEKAAGEAVILIGELRLIVERGALEDEGMDDEVIDLDGFEFRIDGRSV
jgi:hypothetical protein